MKKILFLLLISSFAFAQNKNSVWCFGDSARINFSTVSVTTGSSAVKSRGSCASIADSAGNLLFYTRDDPQGNTTVNYLYCGDVLNSNDTIMENGDSLVSDGWYHEQLIIPDPANNNSYYLFTSGVTIHFGLYYSRIDLNYNNGLGKVTQKNIQLSSTQLVDVLSAVKHGNGRDWWVLCKKQYAATFPYALSDTLTEFLVTPNGISQPTDISVGTPIGDGFAPLVFSNAGNKLLIVTPNGLVEIYDFDRCTGAITNPVTIHSLDTSGTSIPWFWGAAFSPNDSLIYITCLDQPSYIIQYNLFAANISASLDTVGALMPGGANFNRTAGAIKLGPDGKIYIAACLNYSFPYNDTLFIPANMNLATIDSPNVPGVGCHYNNYGFYLGGKRVYWGLPNNPDYEMGVLQGSACDSLTALEEEQLVVKGELNVFYYTGWQKLFVNAHNIKGSNCNLKIINAMGQIVFKSKTKTQPPYFTQEINCASFNNGIYFVELQTEKEKLDARFVKQ